MNINVKDTKKNYTGLQLAVVNNRIEIIDYLLSFESMSFLKKNANETIFNTNVKSRPCKSAMPIITTAAAPQSVQTIEVPAIEVTQDDQLTKRRSSSAISSSVRDKRQNSIVSLEAKQLKKENKSMQSWSNLNQESSYDILEEAINAEQSPPKIFNVARPTRPRTCAEPLSYYPVAEMFKTDSARISNFQIVDIHSLNNDGHNGICFYLFEISIAGPSIMDRQYFNYLIYPNCKRSENKHRFNSHQSISRFSDVKNLIFSLLKQLDICLKYANSIRE